LNFYRSIIRTLAYHHHGCFQELLRALKQCSHETTFCYQFTNCNKVILPQKVWETQFFYGQNVENVSEWFRQNQNSLSNRCKCNQCCMCHRFSIIQLDYDKEKTKHWYRWMDNWNLAEIGSCIFEYVEWWSPAGEKMCFLI
jgi:hypothetical protein